jgi:hypothetical protein
MALTTDEEYKASLKYMRPNIYKFGKLIEDVTTHPATRNAIEGHASLFRAQSEEQHRQLLTTASHLTRRPDQPVSIDPAVAGGHDRERSDETVRLSPHRDLHGRRGWWRASNGGPTRIVEIGSDPDFHLPDSRRVHRRDQSPGLSES